MYTKNIDLSEISTESQNTLSPFICPLCNSISLDMVLDQFGHLFCRECFTNYLKDNTTSPITGETYTTSFFPYNNELIKEIKVSCRNNHLGCLWQGSISDISSHIQICSKEMIECDNFGCNETISRDVYQAHLEKCDYRTIICQKCNAEIKYINSKSHQLVCPKEKISCPQNCGETFLKEEVVNHVNHKCQNTLVNCPFSQFGCVAKIIKDQIVEHIGKEIGKHRVLLAEGMNKYINSFMEEMYMEIDKEIRFQLEEKIKDIIVEKLTKENEMNEYNFKYK